MKIYSEELGKEILKQFPNIPEERLILGSLEDQPPPSWLESLKENDKIIIVNPAMIEEAERTEAQVTHLYRYEIYLYLKLPQEIWLWKNRFNQGNELYNQMWKWTQSIESKEFGTGFIIKTAEVSVLNYSPLKGFFNEMLDINIMAVSVEVRILTITDLRLEANYV